MLRYMGRRSVSLPVFLQEGFLGLWLDNLAVRPNLDSRFLLDPLEPYSKKRKGPRQYDEILSEAVAGRDRIRPRGSVVVATGWVALRRSYLRIRPVALFEHHTRHTIAANLEPVQ